MGRTSKRGLRVRLKHQLKVLKDELVNIEELVNEVLHFFEHTLHGKGSVFHDLQKKARYLLHFAKALFNIARKKAKKPGLAERTLKFVVNIWQNVLEKYQLFTDDYQSFMLVCEECIRSEAVKLRRCLRRYGRKYEDLVWTVLEVTEYYLDNLAELRSEVIKGSILFIEYWTVLTKANHYISSIWEEVSGKKERTELENMLNVEHRQWWEKPEELELNDLEDGGSAQSEEDPFLTFAKRSPDTTIHEEELQSLDEGDDHTTPLTAISSYGSWATAKDGDKILEKKDSILKKLARKVSSSVSSPKKELQGDAISPRHLVGDILESAIMEIVSPANSEENFLSAVASKVGSAIESAVHHIVSPESSVGSIAKKALEHIVSPHRIDSVGSLAKGTLRALISPAVKNIIHSAGKRIFTPENERKVASAVKNAVHNLTSPLRSNRRSLSNPFRGRYSPVNVFARSPSSPSIWSVEQGKRRASLEKHHPSYSITSKHSKPASNQRSRVSPLRIVDKVIRCNSGQERHSTVPLTLSQSAARRLRSPRNFASLQSPRRHSREQRINSTFSPRPKSRRKLAFSSSGAKKRSPNSPANSKVENCESWHTVTSIPVKMNPCSRKSQGTWKISISHGKSHGLCKSPCFELPLLNTRAGNCTLKSATAPRSGRNLNLREMIHFGGPTPFTSATEGIRMPKHSLCVGKYLPDRNYAAVTNSRVYSKPPVRFRTIYPVDVIGNDSRWWSRNNTAY